MHARATAEPLCVSRRVKAFTRLIHTWGFRIWLHIDQKVILGHFLLHFNLRPEFKSQGARITPYYVAILFCPSKNKKIITTKPGHTPVFRLRAVKNAVKAIEESS